MRQRKNIAGLNSTLKPHRILDLVIKPSFKCPFWAKKTQVEAIMEKKDYGIPKSSTVETTNIIYLETPQFALFLKPFFSL